MLVRIRCKRIVLRCLPCSGLRQTNRIRALYLQRALQQEVGFFDVHATTGMMMQGLNEDTLIIQQAIGEKVGVTIHFLATFVVGYAIGEAASTCLCLNWKTPPHTMLIERVCLLTGSPSILSASAPVIRAVCHDTSPARMLSDPAGFLEA